MATPIPIKSWSGSSPSAPALTARRLDATPTNYQALPTYATFLESSGVRLGVQEMTRFMKEKDFDELALMSDIVVRKKPAGAYAARYRKNFLMMGYTLLRPRPCRWRPGSSDVIPDPGYTALFVDNLRKAAGAEREGPRHRLRRKGNTRWLLARSPRV